MLINKIKKRDGRKVPFNKNKIENAVFKATKAIGQENKAISREITQEVLSYLNIFYKEEGIPNVEQIQDLVEKILIERGYADIAKAYILYREQHARLRDTKRLFSDALKIINSYLDRSDWRINENSNMGFSLQGLNNHISSKITSQYWLHEIYPKEIRELHLNGDLHIHDLSQLSVYCCGWDLQDLLLTGFSGVSTKVESKPAKHFRTALMQIVNFLYSLQGESAGAQAFANFDTYLSPFIYYDNLSYPEVKQAMQEFIFNMNVPTRVGFQSPFTNITMDLNPSPAVAEQPAIIGGNLMDKSLGEFQKEMDMLNRAFAEIMLEGDAKGRVFSFPIPTYNITRDFDWDNEVLDPLWEMTAKYGIPYFSNFINSDMKPEDARSMCLFPEETLFIKIGDQIKKRSIELVFEDYKRKQIDKEWYECDNQIQTISLNPETGKFEWVKIKRFLKIYDNELITIKTKDGKVMRVSKNHLVAVFNKNALNTKKASAITEDDFLLVIKDGINILNDPINQGDTQDFTVVAIDNIQYQKLNYNQVFYDIELEKNHYFVHSNGNITHNCCRLRLDNRELRKRGGGLFGASPMTGSIGVVTLNMPRIGFMAKDEEDFVNRVYHLMDAARDSLELKRKVLERFTDAGLYPYSKFYLRDIYRRFNNYWQNHFNTIGLNGMNEALINFIGKDIGSNEGQRFTIKLMNLMRDRLVEYQEETDNMYNLEATPAEGTSYRFARLDKELFGDKIISANEERVQAEDVDPYYTNSTQLSVGYTDDIFTALDLQDNLQTLYTGGTVLHGFLGERMPSIESTKLLVKRIAENYHLPYYTITPTFSICPIHGYIPGEHEYCPICDAEMAYKETEIFGG
jgi:anaerobic ribonucleoside-triphosphate reductase